MLGHIWRPRSLRVGRTRGPIWLVPVLLSAEAHNIEDKTTSTKCAPEDTLGSTLGYEETLAWHLPAARTRPSKPSPARCAPLRVRDQWPRRVGRPPSPWVSIRRVARI